MPVDRQQIRFAVGGGKFAVHQVDTFASQLQQYYSKMYVNSDEAYRQSKDQAASMRRDPVIMTPLRARQMAVAFQDWSILPENEHDATQKKVCDDLTKLLQRTRGFFKIKMSLLEAVWFGRYAVNLIYGWAKPTYSKIEIKDWLPIDGDKLRFEQDTGNLGIMASRNTTDEYDEREWRYTDEFRAIMVTRDQRRAIVVHKHEIEDGNFYDPWSAGSIHGVGVRSRVYWPWFLKQKLLQWTMTFLETSGLGINIYYFEEGNDEAERKMREIAENENENLKILIPRPIGKEGQGNGVERLEPGANVNFFSEFLDDYFGDQITRAIVGQTMTSKAEASGLGSGNADEHRKTFSDINMYDAANLDDTMTHELLKVIAESNYPGIDWTPRYVTSVEKVDPQKFMQAAQGFVQLGGEVGENDVREAIGLPKPKKGDKILGQSGAMPGGQPVQPGQPGQPPGGGQPGGDQQSQQGQPQAAPGGLAPPRGMDPPPQGQQGPEQGQQPQPGQPEQFEEEDEDDCNEPLRYGYRYHTKAGNVRYVAALERLPRYILRETAHRLGIRGAWSLPRDKLAEAIQQHQEQQRQTSATTTKKPAKLKFEAAAMPGGGNTFVAGCGGSGGNGSNGTKRRPLTVELERN